MTEAEELLATLSRSERRRIWKDLNKYDDYEKSNFIDQSQYISVKLKSNKYTPHCGKKEKGLI